MSLAYHEFSVTGSPASVNRYGTAPYRNWRGRVYRESTKSIPPGTPINGHCTVVVRYFRNLDRVKDVDNILKAILDALDGRDNRPRSRNGVRILQNDRLVERVACQRTDLQFHRAFSGMNMSPTEYGALLRAQHHQASIYVKILEAPHHDVGVCS